MFQIEDILHAEPQKGKYLSYEDAFNELKKRAQIPWNNEPNKCPCKNWEACGRNYEIVEYDDSTIPWKVLKRYPILKVSVEGVKWTNK